MQVKVSGASQLAAAIQNAHSGDTIVLAAGNYGDLSLKNLSFASNVTITSANPAAEATFNSINLGKVTGLTLSNLEVNVAHGARGVIVADAKNVTLDHLDVHGTLGDGPKGDGSGIFVRSSNHVTVSNSDLHELTNGLYHDNSQYLTFSGNTFHELGQDAIRGGGTSNITITGNYFTNLARSSTMHPDAIQFWTTNTKHGVHDITITNNVYERGDGTEAQGIFLGNEWKMTYTNVTIKGNVMIGGMPNGISVDHAKNVDISDNVVLGFTDRASKIRVENTDGATLTQNTTSHYVLADNVEAHFHRDGTPLVKQLALVDQDRIDALIAAHNLSGLVAKAEQIMGHDGDVDSGGGTSAPSTGGGSGTSGGGSTGGDGGSTGDTPGGWIKGTAGADKLVGTAGNDTVVGGGGGDVFYFAASGGRDHVVDFHYSEGDRIVIQDSSYQVAQVGDDAVIYLKHGGTVVVEGIPNFHALHTDWIVHT